MKLWHAIMIVVFLLVYGSLSLLLLGSWVGDLVREFRAGQASPTGRMPWDPALVGIGLFAGLAVGLLILP